MLNNEFFRNEDAAGGADNVGPKSEGQLLAEKLFLRVKNCWDEMDEGELEKTAAFAESYKAFLDKGKTEREFAAECTAALKEAGFMDIDAAMASPGGLLPG